MRVRSVLAGPRVTGRPGVPLPRPRPGPLRFVAAVALVAALATWLTAWTPSRAAEATPAPMAGPSMTARALFDGHARAGSWFAVAVDLENSGPAITGELRLEAASGSRARFSTSVDLPTGSRKQYVLYAQAPAFGSTVTVTLVGGDRSLGEAKVAIALHDASQLVVGIVAENPGRIVGQLDLLPSQQGTLPVLVPLALDALPERVEGWAGLDRLVWQDVDTASLTPGQVSALRAWVAGGGRLVVVGGTAGADLLTGLPDDLLPFRPSSVLEVDPERIRPFLGGLPLGATPLAALAGEPGRGQPLATSGDRVVAAELRYGSGWTTIVGFDPTTSWIAEGDTLDAPMWRRLLPPRTGDALAIGDDGQLVGAVTNIPSLALPPIGGLLVLLLGYIILVGPVNYLVLRRLDRREWAWVTVPALIAVFAVGSFAFGAALRGSDVIVHEVAVVRGSAGTSEAIGRSYYGLFSPNRATYQLSAPGGALLSATISDPFGDSAAVLDVLQGDPSRVRNLAVGFSSLRTLRAEAATVGPVVDADLRLEGGRVRGTIRNRSERTLVAPAVVLGSSSVVLADIAPGAEATVDLALVSNPFDQAPLSERIVGQVFFPGDGSSFNEESQRKLVRRSVIEQLSWDPFKGISNQLNAEGPMLLAWGTDPVIPVEVDGQAVRRIANVLYEVALPLAIRGEVAFRSDLLRTSTVAADASFFSKDPWSTNMGVGTAQLAYRPIPFDGSFRASQVAVTMWPGGGFDLARGNAQRLEPAERCDPDSEECPIVQDGLPDIDVLDRRTGEWVQFPHLDAGVAYELAEPARWVDPATGELQVRFVNERMEGVSFSFSVELQGVVG